MLQQLINKLFKHIITFTFDSNDNTFILVQTDYLLKTQKYSLGER